MATTIKVTDTRQIAITTRYVGPTNTRGSRIIARANGHKVTVSSNHALSIEARHAEAAIALCNKLGWNGTLAQGGTESGYAFVFVDAAA